MTALEQRRYTEDEYLELERMSDTKHEFYGGEIFAMTGGTRTHALICHNVDVRLGMQILERPCQIYGSDMRLKVEATGLQTYPDLTGLCDEPRFSSQTEDTLLNPSFIVEVLSKSTQEYDRQEKFRHYSKIESLLEYVLISQYGVYAQHFTKQPDGYWRLKSYEALEDTFTLESIGCTLELGQIYWKVTLEG